MEFDSSSKMVFLRAKIVGGTSIVNQALLDRFDDFAFNDWKSESGIDFFDSQKMSPYYDAVENNIKLHTFNKNDFINNAKQSFKKRNCVSCFPPIGFRIEGHHFFMLLLRENR